MTTLTTDTSREQWLIKSARIIEDTILLPAIAAAGQTLEQPLAIKVSIGFPKGSKTAIGQAWARSASTDNTNAIFISPLIDDSIRVLDVLVHEMVHCADNLASGHKNFFAKVARKAGLIGKLTETKAGDFLTEQLEMIISILGEIPHSKLKDNYQPKKKQKSRMIKVECTACTFSFRTSQTNIDNMTNNICNVCNSNSLTTGL